MTLELAFACRSGQRDTNSRGDIVPSEEDASSLEVIRLLGKQ
jgi:hypothetical protein